MFQVLLFVVPALVLCEYAPTDVVNTTLGPVQGKVEKGINKYLGIPYAEPPVDDLRFCNPVPKTPWTDTRKCVKVGASCPQIPIIGELMIGHEDCLFLDVYTPQNPKSKKLPVYVWIYGGGYIGGDKYEFSVYDPHAFLTKHDDMIFVAMNYRLGALGFLANTAIVNKYHPGSVGNQGLLDQVLALEWVQANIANFGGDPDHVTIGGESAGAFSTLWHLASPVSKGLFSAALAESGTGDSRQFYYKKDEFISFSEAVSYGMKCKENGTQQELLDCMRTKKPGQLLSFVDILAKYHATHFIPELYPAMPWGAVVDGVVLNDLPTNVFKQGKGNNVPLLIGTNQREGSLFLFWVPQAFPGVDRLMKPIIGHFVTNETDLDRVITAYGIYPNTKYDKQKAEDLLTDYFFKCATRRISRAFVKAKQPVYQYNFNFMGGFVTKLMKDCHAAELPFVFDNFDTLPLGPDKAQKQMSATFQHYWRNWIINRNPNKGGASAEYTFWPPYGNDTVLNMTLPAVRATDDHLCDMWDDISSRQW